VVYATIDEGLITVVAANLEGQSNYRTIEELQSNLDPTCSGACTGRTW
jgi:two-component system LytT family response regulator/two-component system response regulator LytT